MVMIRFACLECVPAVATSEGLAVCVESCWCWQHEHCVVALRLGWCENVCCFTYIILSHHARIRAGVCAGSMNVVLYHDGEGGADARDVIRRHEFYFESPKLARMGVYKFNVLITTPHTVSQRPLAASFRVFRLLRPRSDPFSVVL